MMLSDLLSGIGVLLGGIASLAALAFGLQKKTSFENLGALKKNQEFMTNNPLMPRGMAQ